jgi:hypothetical protein
MIQGVVNDQQELNIPRRQEKLVGEMFLRLTGG